MRLIPEQAPQDPQTPHEAQTWALVQASVSVASPGHVVAPELSQVRARDREPVPHVTEQADH